MFGGPFVVALEKTTNAGQLYATDGDTAAYHTVGSFHIATDGAIYQYWKNTTAAALVAGDAYFKGFGNIIQAETANPQAVLATAATAQAGQIGQAQSAVADESYGWFLVYGATTNGVGKLFFGNNVNHTDTDTTTVGEPLGMTDGKFVDDTTWALGGDDALPHWAVVALEVVTTATSCHVFFTGEEFLSAT